MRSGRAWPRALRTSAGPRGRAFTPADAGRYFFDFLPPDFFLAFFESAFLPPDFLPPAFFLNFLAAFFAAFFDFLASALATSGAFAASGVFAASGTFADVVMATAVESGSLPP